MYCNFLKKVVKLQLDKEKCIEQDKLQKIADFLGVSLEYLTTGKEKEWEPTFTEKDERDVQKELEKTLNALQNDTGLMFDGEVLDDETRELLEASLEHAIRTAKITAKKKFTPNKYRKQFRAKKRTVVLI